MNNLSTPALKVVLILLGLYVIFLSIDWGLGGFMSLGLQGKTDFLQITDEMRYGMQDSNFRFYAGSFAVIGIFLIYATTNLKKHHNLLNLIFMLVFIGGVTRFASGDFQVLFSAEIALAIFVETLCMVILYFWLAHEVKIAE